MNGNQLIKNYLQTPMKSIMQMSDACVPWHMLIVYLNVTQ